MPVGLYTDKFIYKSTWGSTSMPKLRIAVLIGGRSAEREVSLNSGRTVCDYLDSSRFEVIPIFQNLRSKLFILPWKFLHRGKISDFEHRLPTEAKEIYWEDLKKIADIVYIAFHGKYGEDGTVQGFLEILGIPYIGSKIFSSALGMHKSKQKDFLIASGILVPDGITISIPEIKNLKNKELFFKEKIINKLKTELLKFPLIVKPESEGSSIGVLKVKNIDELLIAIKNASTITKHKMQPVIVEEFIDGMEFSCIVITDLKNKKLRALPPTEIIIEAGTEIFNYDQKYMPGRALKYTPARCSKENIEKIKSTCKKVTKALNFNNIARIDGFLTKDEKVIITDPNSFCGMSPSSYPFLQAAEENISHTEFINHLVETELKNLKIRNKFSNPTDKKSTEKKIKIAVILGGNSHEKEISLESGRNIIYKLSPHKYEITALFLNKNLELFKINQKQLVKNKTIEIEESLELKDKIRWDNLKEKFDFIFIALHGGVGENGAIQGTLEILEIPYNGSSVMTSALCMDKYQTNKFLKQKGFNTPHNILLSKKEWEKNKGKNITLSFPLIVKPHDDGCSVMVEKVENKTELNNAINKIFKSNKQYAFIEEFIVGTELTVGLIGNEKAYALPLSATISNEKVLSLEEKFLPGAGENQTPAPLNQRTTNFIQKTLEKVYADLGCKGYARIDCFYQDSTPNATRGPAQSSRKKERLVIIEINTLPAMTPATCLFHQAAEIGIKPMDFVDLIVELGLKEHTKNKSENKNIKLFNDSKVKKIYQTII